MDVLSSILGDEPLARSFQLVKYLSEGDRKKAKWVYAVAPETIPRSYLEENLRHMKKGIASGELSSVILENFKSQAKLIAGILHWMDTGERNVFFITEEEMVARMI